MEDSLKGILVSVTVIALFMIAILNFIVMFPQEQGVVFTDLQSQTGYLVINSTASSSQTETTAQLTEINNQSSTGFNQWDITEGFMGSNTIKQTSQSGISGATSNIFTNLNIIAKQVFGSGSPVIYVISIFLSLASAYLIYATIQFVRTGR